MRQKEILNFIERRFPHDSNWTNGNCYYFAVILSNRFGGEIFYDVIHGHFICSIDYIYYDYNGIVDLTDRTLVAWKGFEEYDSLQYTRVMKDCIV